MDDLAPGDLKSILHSKRANIYYLEHCRVLVNGGRVEYVTDEGKRSLYWTRLQRIYQQWTGNRALRDAGFAIDSGALKSALEASSHRVATALDNTALLTEETRLTKHLFKLAAVASQYGDFARAKRGSGGDPANQFLDHGNYLAYGLGATATWVLGLPHGLAVLHGKTRRGGLVFDVADLVKDAHVLPQALPPICCAWIDEFHQVRQDCTKMESFTQQHLAFVQRRHAELGKAVARRRTALLPLALGGLSREEGRRRFASQLRDAAIHMHLQHHDSDVASGKRVSFGLARMASIEPLYDVALALYALGAPAGTRIHLCVYHSQYPLLLRSAIERQLDAALDRRDEQAVFTLPDIRERLDPYEEPDQIFIVLGSPVTEVGRDHSYNWAVVEPHPPGLPAWYSQPVVQNKERMPLVNNSRLIRRV